MEHTSTTTNRHARLRAKVPEAGSVRDDDLAARCHTKQIAWYVVVDDENFDMSEELLGFFARRAEADVFAAGLRTAGIDHVGVYQFDMDSA
jgi:hypothetical protein